jgi:nicotinic acid mononucleotide adenylyltransferase
MLKRALKPHGQFGLLELVDVSFSVERTLPALQQRFPGSQLVFLFGSDVVPGLADWPKADRLLTSSELVIGLRAQDDHDKMQRIIEAWPAQPRTLTMFPSYAPDVSSGRVREALRRRQATPGLLTSVERYSDRNWLYVSLA